MAALVGRGAALGLHGLDVYHAWFPLIRLDVATARLSRIDEWLLSGLSSTKWSTSVNIIGKNRPLAEFWIFNLGDLLIWYRLSQWVSHPSRAVEATAMGPSPYSMAYRLTNVGNALLKRGIVAASQVPVGVVGGHTSYDKPWFHFSNRDCSHLILAPTYELLSDT
jgi:hypothetical protein